MGRFAIVEGSSVCDVVLVYRWKKRGGGEFWGGSLVAAKVGSNETCSAPYRFICLGHFNWPLAFPQTDLTLNWGSDQTKQTKRAFCLVMLLSRQALFVFCLSCLHLNSFVWFPLPTRICGAIGQTCRSVSEKPEPGQIWSGG